MDSFDFQPIFLDFCCKRRHLVAHRSFVYQLPMQRLTYLLALPFIYLVARLPFPLLYFFSERLCFFLYTVFGYRKAVVRDNLEQCFTQLNAEQRKKIEIVFYSYFCDIILESLKLLTISKKSLLKRVDVSEIKHLDEYARKGQSVIVGMGHIGNWEWACAALAHRLSTPFHVIYHPLSNPWFDKLLYKMRARHSTILHPMKSAAQQVLRNRDEVNVTVFLADQTPPPQTAFWTTFLYRETPFYQGLGKLSKKLDTPVIFLAVKRVKRGYYKITEEILVKEAGLYTTDEILRRYATSLHLNILSQPAFWLWTHRRWKHERDPSQQLIT